MKKAFFCLFSITLIGLNAFAYDRDDLMKIQASSGFSDDEIAILLNQQPLFAEITSSPKSSKQYNELKKKVEKRKAAIEKLNPEVYLPKHSEELVILLEIEDKLEKEVRNFEAAKKVAAEEAQGFNQYVETKYPSQARARSRKTKQEHAADLKDYSTVAGRWEAYYSRRQKPLAIENKPAEGSQEFESWVHYKEDTIKKTSDKRTVSLYQAVDNLINQIDQFGSKKVVCDQNQNRILNPLVFNALGRKPVVSERKINARRFQINIIPPVEEEAPQQMTEEEAYNQRIKDFEELLSKLRGIDEKYEKDAADLFNFVKEGVLPESPEKLIEAMETLETKHGLKVFSKVAPDGSIQDPSVFRSSSEDIKAYWKLSKENPSSALTLRGILASSLLEEIKNAEKGIPGETKQGPAETSLHLLTPPSPGKQRKTGASSKRNQSPPRNQSPRKVKSTSFFLESLWF